MEFSGTTELVDFIEKTTKTMCIATINKSPPAFRFITSMDEIDENDEIVHAVLHIERPWALPIVTSNFDDPSADFALTDETKEKIENSFKFTEIVARITPNENKH